MWRQRGDHWAGHEEIVEVKEAERVERAAKRLVNEVKVSDLAFLEDMQVYHGHIYMCLKSTGRDENDKVS